jgi:hypothetical protein
MDGSTRELDGSTRDVHDQNRDMHDQNRDMEQSTRRLPLITAWIARTPASGISSPRSVPLSAVGHDDNGNPERDPEHDRYPVEHGTHEGPIKPGHGAASSCSLRTKSCIASVTA